jgi:hypothetical protein
MVAVGGPARQKRPERKKDRLPLLRVPDEQGRHLLACLEVIVGSRSTSTCKPASESIRLTITTAPIAEWVDSTRVTGGRSVR